MSVITQFIGLFILGVLTDAANASCDADGIEACAEGFQRNLTIAGISTDTNVFTGVSVSGYKTQLDTVCSTYEVFKTCTNGNIDDCKDEDGLSKTVFYLNKMFEYQCHTARQEMIKHASCWVDTDVARGNTDCINRHMKQHLSEMRKDLKKICMYVFDSLICSGHVVYNKCGADAAVIYSRFAMYAQLMTADMVSCPEIQNTFASSSNNPFKTGNFSTIVNPYKQDDGDANSSFKLGSSSAMIYLTAFLCFLKYPTFFSNTYDGFPLLSEIPYFV